MTHPTSDAPPLFRHWLPAKGSHHFIARIRKVNCAMSLWPVWAFGKAQAGYQSGYQSASRDTVWEEAYHAGICSAGSEPIPNTGHK